LVLKQFESISQNASVAEYIAEFEESAHNLLLYNPNYDETYFVTRFLTGLREDIRSGIVLHRPPNVDTASALALLQETELSKCKSKSVVRDSYRANFRTMGDKLKTGEPDKPKQQVPVTETEDKLANLKSFRRRNGLCFKCGNKWSKDHKCPPQVALHVIEELLDALEAEDLEDPEPDPDAVEETVMVVNNNSSPDQAKRKTMKLCGQIGKKEVLILVDSGSVASFVSTQLVTNLQLQSVPCKPTSFVAADGSPMVCERQVQNLQWKVQGQSFTSSVGILPLKCFDMILGEDWLEECSPMWVHWGNKVMRFTYQGRRVELFGVKQNSSHCAAISSSGLQGLLSREAVQQCLLFKMEEYQTESSGAQELYSVSLSEIGEVPPNIQILLQQYADLFQEPKALPPQRSFDHHIQLLPGAPPVNVRPYKYSPAQKDEIEKQLAEMLRNGIIKPSQSPYASPVLLVKKKDGTWRFCVDYRHLNAQTVKNKHPMPIVDVLIDELAGAQWFSKLDFRAGYHQICIHPEDTHKTAFKTHNGLYEFLVMAFGLTNAPATFQSVMNLIFAALLRKGVLVFMDDILIYSATLADHVKLLQQVFDILRQHKFFIKLSKCSFAQKEIEYLGHCISSHGVATEKSKIAAVELWSVPKNVKELRGFLGLTGYYRKFIRHYDLISRSLTDLLKKGTPFVWTSQAHEAFNQLKIALVNAPVLAIPDFSKPFVLETDASDVGFGAVLLQNSHPVAYLSKAVCAKNQALSTYEKECMAIILAVDKWRPYLQNAEFIIRTDHKSLLHLTEQRISTRIQQKALLKLMDLRFNILYKQGALNRAADALSRCYSPTSLMAISFCNPDWMEQVKLGYAEDSQTKQLLANPTGEYSVDDGIIRHQGRVWLGSNKLAQQHVLQAIHCSGVGGHSGFQSTYYRIRHLFSWPGMKAAIAQFVKECQICQQAKTEHVKPPGLLQPLLIPDQAWQVVCMDFIEGLPKSQKFDTIMVVIDKYTKYAHFIPLAHPFAALTVAQAYLDYVYKLHGLPKGIVSDRDKIFTSAIWKELFRLSDTQLMMSSSYHPQTDGQSERLNQCLEGFLRCAVHSCPRQWNKWLAVAELWYNTSYYSALGRSPFEVLYGHPRQFGFANELQFHSSDLEQWLTERHLLTDMIQHHLHCAQQRMKSYADKGRSEREFKVGDEVYLRLQPYIQSSVAPRSNHKLSFRFYGPFPVIKRVGAVAYELQLPEKCRIHPVVHVSQLKRHVPSSVRVEDDISQVPLDPTATLMPIKFIGSRLCQKGASTISQILVQWDSIPDSLTTWEEAEDLHRRFPKCPAWGQAGFRGGGNVRVKGTKKHKKTGCSPTTEAKTFVCG